VVVFLPVIVTEVVLVTLMVVTTNVAVVDPAGTVTLAGTVATEVRLLESVTTAPPAGAGPLSVTVPVEGVPPRTLLGLRVREDSVGAVTVNVARRVVPRYVAEILGEALLATGLVVTVNVTAVVPAATVTLAGTWAAEVLSLAKVTTAPPAGAGPLRVTVPVDGLPPTTEVGFRLIELNEAAVTVSVAVRVTLL
jgi:hypothetical protein